MTRTQDFRANSAHVLPERPHLEHLRGEAKSRHAILKSLSHSARLSDAQLLVARSYGFHSWMALKAEVDRRRLLCGTVEVPVVMMLRPPQPRRQVRIADLASPAMAEQALFPVTVLGFMVVQVGGTCSMLLRALLG
jgi:hypothetical protein